MQTLLQSTVMIVPFRKAEIEEPLAIFRQELNRAFDRYSAKSWIADRLQYCSYLQKALDETGLPPERLIVDLATLAHSMPFDDLELFDAMLALDAALKKAV